MIDNFRIKADFKVNTLEFRQSDEETAQGMRLDLGYKAWLWQYQAGNLAAEHGIEAEFRLHRPAARSGKPGTVAVFTRTQDDFERVFELVRKLHEEPEPVPEAPYEKPRSLTGEEAKAELRARYADRIAEAAARRDVGEP